ncbi:MAG: NADH-quinone oxidoreductase subunit N [Planctomycetota bacterium]
MLAIQDLARVFETTFAPAARLAMMPLLALGVGMLLYLGADIVRGLRAARPLIFAGTIVVAFLAQLNIGFFLEEPPGLVLQGTYLASRETALWGCLFLLATLFAWLYSLGYYRRSRAFQPEHDALFLAAAAGMTLMAGAGDLVVFFVGLELLSLPLYALAAFRRAKLESVEAGLKYFLLGAFSSALFLYGAGLLYTAAGTLSIEALIAFVAAAPEQPSALAVVGGALIAASLFFKTSVFPFHLWVPDVYQGSPTPVTALMAAGTKAAAFAFLIRVAGILPENSMGVVAGIALATLAAGNLGALVQTDLKRMLAYSGVANAGTLLLLVVAAQAGIADAVTQQAALFYVLAYLASVVGAFGILSLLETDGARFTSVDSIAGLGRSRPMLSLALGLFLLSLGGLPATGGFLGKWFVFATLVEADLIPLAVVAILFSVIALAYYLRVIIALFMQPAPVGPAPTTLRLGGVLTTAACVLLVLATGLLPGLWLDLV